MEHLAETFHVIFGDVDFTVSDRHVALVLATALQQNRRHDRIKECLLEGADPLVGHPCRSCTYDQICCDGQPCISASMPSYH